MQLPTTFLGLGLLLPHALALGTVTIVNQCPFTVNLWSVSNVQGPQVSLPSGTGTYSQTYQTNPNGGGISIKITNEDSLSDPITQLEYTLGTGSWANLVWYDLSNINGEPFSSYGVTLASSDPTCGGVVCTPGDPSCGQNIYQEPDDDYAVHACSVDASLVFTLCTGSGGSSSSPPAAQSTSSSSSMYIISETYWPSGMATNPGALSPQTTSTPVVPACTPTSASQHEVTVTRTTFITHYTTTDSYTTVTAAARAKQRRSRFFFG